MFSNTFDLKINSGLFRGPISSQRMKKLNMIVSDSALKTLKHLKLIELDKKGLVSLLVKD